MLTLRTSIAKNSIMLYIRMLITTGISVFTSRAVLEILGVIDFGIYNVVGGIVIVLGFVNGSLAGASTRFLTYAIGAGDKDKERHTFSTLLIIHRSVALFLAVIIEIVGVWFLYNKMNIPADRMGAAFWVLQCSVLTSTISLISVPYNSLIIANERMDAFAYISVFESIAKLGIVYSLLLLGNADRLIVYAILMCVLQITVRIIYGWFCRKNFSVTHSHMGFDKHLTKQMAVFIGWKINGDLAFVGCGQGLNIVLNMFFGPVVNAARGISVQIQNITNTFIQSYQMALQPQIIKSYAGGNLSYMRRLVIICSKYGFYLMLMVAFPILNYTEFILNLWLVRIPKDTVFLVRIILLVCFITPLRQPLIQSINATGKIKRFQIIEGTILLMAVPVAYIGLRYFQFSLFTVMVSYLCIEYIAQIARIWIVLPYIEFSYREYSKEILYPIGKVTIVLVAIHLFIKSFLSNTNWEIFCGLCLSELLCITICFSLGINSIERQQIIMFITNRIKQCKNRNIP